MDRYLVLDDPRSEGIEWLVRRVEAGNTYLDLTEGQEMVRVAEEGDRIIELQIRLRHAPELQDWRPVGSATIGTGKSLEPTLRYNQFPLRLHQDQVLRIMAWALDGFPYGVAPEMPAKAQEQLVIRVFETSGKRCIERYPQIAFSGYQSTGRFVDFMRYALKQTIPEDGDGSEYMAMPITENARSDQALIEYFDQLVIHAAEDNDYYEFV